MERDSNLFRYEPHRARPLQGSSTLFISSARGRLLGRPKLCVPSEPDLLVQRSSEERRIFPSRVNGGGRIAWADGLIVAWITPRAISGNDGVQPMAGKDRGTTLHPTIEPPVMGGRILLVERMTGCRVQSWAHPPTRNAPGGLTQRGVAPPVQPPVQPRVRSVKSGPARRRCTCYNPG